MSDELAVKVAKAQKGDARTREELLKEFSPKVIRWAGQACRRYVDPSDDVFSIGMVALNHAIDTFNGKQAASFQSYALVVVKNKVIDYLRSEGRHQHLSLQSVAFEDEDLPAKTRGETDQAWANYQREEEARERREEMLTFARKLKDFGITWNDLVEGSPKHRAKREKCMTVARVLAADETLWQHLVQRGQLPAKQLSLQAGTSRKLLESSRKYIIALALILRNPQEFTYLHTYLRFPT